MSGDEEYTDGKLEARLRRIIVEDPAAAPARIVRLIKNAAVDIGRPEWRLTVILVLLGFALGVGFGVAVGHWVWRAG